MSSCVISSLSCVNRHKVEHSCSRLQNKTEFVPLNEFTDNHPPLGPVDSDNSPQEEARNEEEGHSLVGGQGKVCAVSYTHLTLPTIYSV